MRKRKEADYKDDGGGDGWEWDIPLKRRYTLLVGRGNLGKLKRAGKKLKNLIVGQQLEQLAHHFTPPLAPTAWIDKHDPVSLCAVCSICWSCWLLFLSSVVSWSVLLHLPFDPLHLLHQKLVLRIRRVEWMMMITIIIITVMISMLAAIIIITGLHSDSEERENLLSCYSKHKQPLWGSQCALWGEPLLDLFFFFFSWRTSRTQLTRFFPFASLWKSLQCCDVLPINWSKNEKPTKKQRKLIKKFISLDDHKFS